MSVRSRIRYLATGIACAGLLICAPLAAASEPSHHSALAAYSALPLRFEANAGQAAPDAHYVARGRGYSVAVNSGGGALRLRMPGGNRTSLLRWRLAGGNSAIKPEPLDRLPGSTNYLVGSDPGFWHTNIPNYSRVAYRGVYPGIDVIYYGNQRRLEYDFVLAPGATVQSLALQYEGARNIRIGSEGDLLLAMEAGELRVHRPAAYQLINGERVRVEAGYVLRAGDTVGITAGRYDRARPLVIDPILQYASYFGGSGDDQPNAMAMDESGNVYIAGTTTSSNFPVIRGGQASFSGGSSDAFVTKISADGTAVLYSTYLGGAGADSANGVAVDPSGNVYIAGTTTSPNFPTTPGSFNVNYFGNNEAFVVKINPQGNGLVYSGYLGGVRDDSASAIAVDSAGNAYVTGRTNSNTFPTTFGAFQRFRSGIDYDVFATRINTAGTALDYSTFLAGIGDDTGNAIAVDSHGTAYIAGTTVSVNFPVTVGAFQLTCGKGADAFVTRLNASGSALVYSSCMGGDDADGANAITVDGSGNAYVAGVTASKNFITSATAFQKSCGNDQDAFITKWNPEGTNLFYSTCLGGGDDEAAFAIAIDSSGNAYVTGQTNSGDFPITQDSILPGKANNIDAFVTELNGNGSAVLSSTFFGGNGDDRGIGIAIDSSNHGHVVGSTTSSNLLTTEDAVSRTAPGSRDVFVIRLQFSFRPSINAGGIVNGASFVQGPVAAGSVVSLFGTDLATRLVRAATVPLPPALDGAELFINGQRVPMFFASPSQINFQMPPLAAGTASALVRVNGIPTGEAAFNVSASAPGIFFDPQTRQAIAQNQDGTLNGPGSPAAPGSVVVVYLTGIGAVDNPVPLGLPSPASPLSRALLPAAATISGMTAQIQFLGYTPGFVGLSQANLVVPQSAPSGSQPLTITVGSASSNTADIWIR